MREEIKSTEKLAESGRNKEKIEFNRIFNFKKWDKSIFEWTTQTKGKITFVYFSLITWKETYEKKWEDLNPFLIRIFSKTPN